MPDIFTGITAGVQLLGGAMSGGSAESASSAQQGMSREQIAENNQRYAAYQAAVAPYTSAGKTALSQQTNLLGLNGANSQSSAISSIANSPYFQSLTKQSEDAMLQNAAATGGLRGGNTQDALSKNRPMILQSLIDKQLANLGGLSSQGLNAEINLGSAGQGVASQNAQAYQDIGAAQAGGILGQNNSMVSTLGQVGGLLANKFIARPTGNTQPLSTSGAPFL